MNGKLPSENIIYKATALATTQVILGELFYGACKSDRIEENMEKAERYLATAEFIVGDKFTAITYGQIKARLKKIGRPIPENDLWIAAIAAQHDLPLVTRDKHFLVIDEIEIVEPFPGALKLGKK